MYTFFTAVPREFTRRVLTRFRDEIGAIVLFGSAARDEAVWSDDVDLRSDIDILIITPQPDELKEGILKLQVDLDLESGMVTNIIYRRPGEIARHYQSGDPFTAAILREGVILYDTGAFARLRQRLVGKGHAVPR